MNYQNTNEECRPWYRQGVGYCWMTEADQSRKEPFYSLLPYSVYAGLAAGTATVIKCGPPNRNARVYKTEDEAKSDLAQALSRVVE